MKKYSIHANNCPDDCTHGWTVEKLIKNFNINKTDIEKLGIGESLDINEDLILQRDE